MKTEKIPRFEGEIEDTYVEVEAVGELGAKRLLIELGVPGSKFQVYLSGEELSYFFSQVHHETTVAMNEVHDDDDVKCWACSCDNYTSRITWYTKDSFDQQMGPDDDADDIRELCGNPTEFPVALCGDCTCPK